jgi:hypothetical protein
MRRNVRNITHGEGWMITKRKTNIAGK